MPDAPDPALTFPRTYARALQLTPELVQDRLAWLEQHCLSPLDARRLTTLLRTLQGQLQAEHRAAGAALQEPTAYQLDALTPRRAALLGQLRETLAVLEAVLKAQG